MAAEELAGSRRADVVTDPVARDIARWAVGRQLTPVAMAAIALGFGVIAAAWLSSASMRAEAIAFSALLAAFIAGRAARVMGDQEAAVTQWGVAAYAALTEFAVYAGTAAGASASAAATAGTGLAGPLGVQLRGTFLAGFGGPGTEGVWRLAVAAAIALGLVEMTGMCLAAREADAARPVEQHAFPWAPGGARLLLLGAAVPLAGARAAFLLLLLFGVLALGAIVARGARADGGRAADTDADPAGGLRSLPGCRGDGPLAVWIGRFVAGRLGPLPPLVVGLLVTGMLAALGLENLSGILMLTPVEAMLLAALASWHSHDGPRDWLAPPLLQAGEYIYLAAAGFAGHLWPPVTFALIAAVLLRHQELACRALARPLPRPSADWRGLGWEGRLIIAGIAAAAGILPVIYPLLAVYLWALFALEFAVGWSAGHAAVDS
jgi:hypothetical protein